MALQPSKVVVITGSTRGIGFGMAREFLRRGCRVVICGRSKETTHGAAVALAEQFDPARVLGVMCDVRFYDQVQALWDAAVARFGRVDIWINNAGLGTGQANLWEQTPEAMAAVVETNLLGMMYGCRVAITGMLAAGVGEIYNLEGLGSNGRHVEGLALYGATKAATRYLTDSLVRETQDTPVLIGSLNPGMVTTDLLLGRYDRESEAWARARSVFNILADRVETVAPWMVERVLRSSPHGMRHQWLTLPKLAWRFLTAPFHRRHVVD